MSLITDISLFNKNFILHNEYSFVIIKYKNIDNIRDILIKINDHYKTNNNVKIEIDFNPLHIM